MENRVKALEDRMEKIEERVIKGEIEQAETIIYVKEIKDALREIKEELKKIKPSDITPTKATFWQSDIAKLLTKTGCIIAVLLTMAAVGMNYFKEYLAVIAK